MFNTIKIHNYKGIVDLELFKVPQILLIGGSNNIGKSTLLEAIFLVLDRFNPDLLSRHFHFRGISGIPITSDSWWRPIFRNYDFSNTIKIELSDTKSKSLVFTIDYDPSYKMQQAQQATIIPAKTPSSESGFATTSNDLLVQSLHMKATYDNKLNLESHLAMHPQGYSVNVDTAVPSTVKGTYISSISRSDPRGDATRFSQLDLENKTEQILEVVKILEPKIKSLSIVTIGDASEIHAEVIGFPRKIPISLMGDGVGRILTIVLSILASKDGLVLVDEIGNGLHHSKLTELWKAINKACKITNCQLIATTHSYESLVAASKNESGFNSSSFSYIRLDAIKNSEKLKITQYTYDELSNALAAEFEVR